MLTQEQAVEVRVLQRQGKGIRAIARGTSLSRVTVRRYLQDPEAAKRYGPRAPRATKLDRHAEYLRARIEAARPAWIPATVVAAARSMESGPRGTPAFIGAYDSRSGSRIKVVACAIKSEETSEAE
jgi:transposase